MTKKMRKIDSSVEVFDPNKSGGGSDLPDGFYAVQIADELVVKADKNGKQGLAVKVVVTEECEKNGWKTSVYLPLESDRPMDLKKIKSAAMSVGFEDEFDTDDLPEILAGKESIIQVKASNKTDPKTGQPYRANMVFVTQAQRDEAEGAKEEKAPAAPVKKPSLADKLKGKK